MQIYINKSNLQIILFIIFICLLNLLLYLCLHKPINTHNEQHYIYQSEQRT